jgi:hypothetical protein
MSEIFISYASQTAAQANQIAVTAYSYASYASDRLSLGSNYVVGL